MEIKWRTERKMREKRQENKESNERVKMMRISNVDETNLETSLSFSTSILEGPVPRPRW